MGLLQSGSLAVAALVAAAAAILLAAGFISDGANAGPAADREQIARGICPDTLCVFTDTDYGGTQVDVTKLGVSNKVDNQIPDQAASLINDRQSAAIFYAKRDGKGRAICINSGDGLTGIQEVQLNGFDSTRLIRRSCAAVLP